MATTTTPRAGMCLLALAAAIAVALAAAAPEADGRRGERRAACDDAKTTPRAPSLVAVRRSAFCLINARRRARGLPRLRFSTRLTRIAQRHARDMARRDYFSHRTPDGRDLRDRVARSSYARGRRWRVGETLGWGRGRRARPMAIVSKWMRSRSHRRVLLSRRYREVGIAVVSRAPTRGRGATYVAEFGARRRPGG